MTQTEKLEWVMSLVATLCQGGYYGSVTFQIQDGDLTIGRLEQTVKPIKKKHWKQMTRDEYIAEKGFGRHG